MFCGKCGKEIQEEAEFCAFCGTKVGTVKWAESTPVLATPSTPIHSSRPVPNPVNPGLCALLSFLWPGAGFFMLQRVGLALTVIFSVLAFDIIVNAIGAAMMGVGLICTIPMSIVLHVAVIIWNYQAAVSFNRGG